jgi:hypothetical protein
MAYSALFALAVFGASAGLTLFSSQLFHAHAAPAATQPAVVQTLPDFAAIVEANKAAVVNITTVESPQQGASVPPLPEELENSPFGEFFRRF